MTGSNPFSGPHPLETGQPIFGRGREIEELYYLLSAERIVLLHSPSGAGKSSLIQAGLIPRLAERFDVRGPARLNTQPAGEGVNRYVRSANLAFEEGLPEERRRDPEFVSRLTLAQYVESRPRRRSAPANVVLIFDQFEEILTADPLAIDAKHEFFRQLGELLQDPKVWALFALREDYLAQLDPYATQTPTHLKNRFRLDLLRREDARDAIVLTAGRGGREITAAAAEKLVTDLATVQAQQPDGTYESRVGPNVEPLQMQVVCRGLWERVKDTGRPIDVKEIEDHADVTGALSRYYDDVVGARRNVREWIGEKLITKDGIRCQVPRSAGSSEGLPNEIISELVDAHLVRAEQRSGAVWYELAHDRLIEPVRGNNEKWLAANLSNFQRRALQWKQGKENPDLLLLSRELDSARCETENEGRFLQASKLARTRRRRWRGALAAFGAALALLAAYSWQQKQTAEATLAQNRVFMGRGQMLDAYNRALDRPDEALAYLEQALLLSPESKEARNWLATLLMDRVRWLPVAENEPFEPDPSLRVEIVKDRFGDVVKVREGDVELASVRDSRKPNAAALSGGRLVTGQASAKIGIAWEATSQNRFARKLDGAISALAFPDEHRLIVAAQGIVERVDPRSPAPGQTRGERLFVVFDISEDGRYAAGLRKSEDTVLRVVDIETGVESKVPYRTGQKAKLSPDGRFVAAYSIEGLDLWDARTGAHLANLPKDGENDIVEVSFSPGAEQVAIGWERYFRVLEIREGKVDPSAGRKFPTAGMMQGLALNRKLDRLAVVTSPGLLMIRDTSDLGVEALPRTALPMMDGSFLRTPRFNAEGDRVLTNDSRAVRLWDAAFGQTVSIPMLAGNREDVISFAITPDGRWAAIGTDEGTVRVFRLWIDASATETGLLSELAGAAGGFRLDENNQPRPLPLSEWVVRVHRLRRQAATAKPGQPRLDSFLREFLRVAKAD